MTPQTLPEHTSPISNHSSITVPPPSSTLNRYSVAVASSSQTKYGFPILTVTESGETNVVAGGAAARNTRVESCQVAMATTASMRSRTRAPWRRKRAFVNFEYIVQRSLMPYSLQSCRSRGWIDFLDLANAHPTMGVVMNTPCLFVEERENALQPRLARGAYRNTAGHTSPPVFLGVIASDSRCAPNRARYRSALTA